MKRFVHRVQSLAGARAHCRVRTYGSAPSTARVKSIKDAKSSHTFGSLARFADPCLTLVVSHTPRQAHPGPSANHGESCTTITVATPLNVAQRQGKKRERLEARVSRAVHGAVLRPSRSNTSCGHDFCRHDHSSSIAWRWAAAGEARRA